ncbi:hypothetical protein RIF29_32910 [Crotalaria pallida]|uniref:F-box domain-containing protein n=1 Tax=Crotalaria pallida TaxID=3830 RepID=A0AAN9E9D5_CROPI
MHKMIEKHKHKKQMLLLLESCEDNNLIRKLPDSILSHILSSLTIREAVRTSILSSEWRYICTNRTDLVLDAENILDVEQQHYSVANLCCHMSEVHRFMAKKSRTYAFVDSVKSYLSRLSEVRKVVKLKVCFTIRRYSYGCNDLDDWINFAIDKNVEEIDLCLLEEEGQIHHARYDDDDGGGALYVFPCDIVGKESETAEKNGSKSFLKCLKLAHCILAPYKSYNYGFTTLTSMELIKVDLVSGEHMLNLLASCTNLEWLSFSECYNMEYLKIEHPFCQKLKYLNVNLCYHLKAIVLRSSNLETLEYKGSVIDFFFDAPRLRTVFSHVSASTASHREIWPVFRLPTDLPYLETLFLECSCYMGGVMRKRLPTFPNLRHLIVIKVAVFRQDLSWIVTALKACPTLTRLELHLRTYLSIDEEIRKTNWPTFTHNHLKEVAITGIRGHSSEIEIAIYLLKNATGLEKMIIDPRPRIYLGNGKWGLSEACEDWSRVGKKKVFENLMQQVCTTSVKLMIY